VHFRFTCLLDDKGHALMIHASPLVRQLGDVLPPAIVVEGVATSREKTTLSRGVELRVQLLDVSRSPDQILAEQVVRSGWLVPIPFALRLPKETSFAGRKLAIVARAVLSQEVVYELREPHAVLDTNFQKPVELVLDRVGPPRR
jgi:uncharacterized lipoprotein YbaY